MDSCIHEVLTLLMLYWVTVAAFHPLQPPQWTELSLEEEQAEFLRPRQKNVHLVARLFRKEQQSTVVWFYSCTSMCLLKWLCFLCSLRNHEVCVSLWVWFAQGRGLCWALLRISTSHAEGLTILSYRWKPWIPESFSHMPKSPRLTNVQDYCPGLTLKALISKSPNQNYP